MLSLILYAIFDLFLNHVTLIDILSATFFLSLSEVGGLEKDRIILILTILPLNEVAFAD
jgi:hypothetical protein